MQKEKSEIRKALPADATAIKSLVNGYAEKGWMLPRSLSEIYESIRDFWVVEKAGQIIGSAALQVCWEDMAEIRSLAVVESARGEGWGKILVKQCLREASDLGVERIFTLTFQPEFFGGLGFKKIEKEDLPQKIWKDCVNCPYFPDCREVAMIIEIEKQGNGDRENDQSD